MAVIQRGILMVVSRESKRNKTPNYTWFFCVKLPESLKLSGSWSYREIKFHTKTMDPTFATTPGAAPQKHFTSNKNPEFFIAEKFGIINRLFPSKSLALV